MPVPTSSAARSSCCLTGVTGTGPAKELTARIAKIDLVDTVATVRLELDNWSGARYTDLFTMLKVDGQWKIMSKVFHLHPEGVASEADS